MLKIIMPIAVLVLASPAHAGAICANLATAIAACGALDINAMPACLRAQEKASLCAVLEGKDAVKAVMAPAWEAFVARRIEQHKQFYGQ